VAKLNTDVELLACLRGVQRLQIEKGVANIVLEIDAIMITHVREGIMSYDHSTVGNNIMYGS
jgi:hypothetical protein